MKGFVCIAVVLTVILLVPAPILSARSIGHQHSHYGHHYPTRDGAMQVKADFSRERRAAKKWHADTLQIAGSSLPDCSHACGSCSPCRLVMGSFVCASLQEAETCPIAYKCMCNKKSYPVP
ncbi:hypothetical protein F0562_008387 [Nyssa sinensis]|uniref:Epidermal patterning factor-like protein n=1 Tax=Nyssa sinensis TaxID=561372 RepID=A0A5J5A7G3_9ASTE|nr:hypothetical protein F0562_008387 [Nyssa sinensis]